MSDTLQTIDQFYTNILAIQPPTADAQNWATLVDDGILKLSDVSTNFVTSLQAQTSVAPIIILCEAELGRTPHQPGLLYWESTGDSLSQIAQKMAGYPGSIGNDPITRPSFLLAITTNRLKSGKNSPGPSKNVAM